LNDPKRLNEERRTTLGMRVNAYPSMRFPTLQNNVLRWNGDRSDLRSASDHRIRTRMPLGAAIHRALVVGMARGDRDRRRSLCLMLLTRKNGCGLRPAAIVRGCHRRCGKDGLHRPDANQQQQRDGNSALHDRRFYTSVFNT
jgi:hypothetical protein